jgi:hypothetical protein
VSFADKNWMVDRFLDIYVDPANRNIARVTLVAIIGACEERARLQEHDMYRMGNENETLPAILAAKEAAS